MGKGVDLLDRMDPAGNRGKALIGLLRRAAIFFIDQDHVRLNSGSAEREEARQAGKSERIGTRLGYRAGYYRRMLITRVGQIERRVPPDRQGRFRTDVFERCQRSGKALVAALLERCVQGVSRRKSKRSRKSAVGTNSARRP